VDMWICLMGVVRGLCGQPGILRRFPPIIHVVMQVIRRYPQPYPHAYPQKFVVLGGYGWDFQHWQQGSGLTIVKPESP